MTDAAVFRAALLDARAPVPAGLTDGAGRPAGRRYAVYRNNVAMSLREALEAGFPAVAGLLGARNFANVAGTYLRRAPPSSPVLTFYGAGFPRFLDGFAPLAHLPYLGDVARIEYALRLSYHAADHAPADPARLAALDEDGLSRVRMTLAPSAHVVASPFPVLSLWRYATEKGAPKPGGGGEEVAILRPGYDPEPRLLPPGGAAVLTALMDGAPLGEALDAAPGADLSAILAPLFETRAIATLHS